MSDETKKPEDKTDDDKAPVINDLEPEKDPAGGTDHDLPPGQGNKTGGAGGA